MKRSGAQCPPSPRSPRVAAAAHSAWLRRAAAPAALVLVALLAACSREATVQPVLAETCLPLGGPRQEITLELRVREAGLLHVAIREQGISVLAAIVTAQQLAQEAASPIVRLGTISLTADVKSRRTVRVHISSIDGRDIAANVCVSAELFANAEDVRARALEALAGGDKATANRTWQAAFDHYLTAARAFDALEMTKQAMAARHAIAELEYGYMRRRRDSIALIATTLTNETSARPELFANRLALMARALMDEPDLKGPPGRTVETLLSESAALYRKSGVGLREIPRLTIFSGFLQYRLGNINRADELFEKASASCRKVSDWECFAQAGQNLAAIAEERQNYPAALADYEDALRVIDASRMPRLVADINDNMARLEGRIGLVHRSELSANLAMTQYARLGDCDGARRSVSTVGEMLVRIGSIGDAATYLDRAELNCTALLRDLAEPKKYAEMAENDALITLARPNMQYFESPALTCTRFPALGNLSLQGSIAVFHSLLARSEIARLDGELDHANGCLSLARSYAADPRSKARLADAQGVLSLEEHRPDDARASFEAASTISQDARLPDTSEIAAITQLGLAETANQAGEVVRSRSLAFSALRLSGARGDIGEMVEALRLLAASFRKDGRLNESELILRTAIRLIENVPMDQLDPDVRAEYLATQHSIFAELTDLLAFNAQHQPNYDAAEHARWQAFGVAEYGHARSFRYALDQTSNADKAGESMPEYRRLMDSISAVTRDDGMQKSIAGLVQQLSELNFLRSATDKVDRDRLMRRLKSAHATLIEYAAGSSSMFAFVIDHERIHIVMLGDVGMIGRAATDLSEALRAPEQNPERIRSAAMRLAELVVWPIARFISQNRVVIVPEDSLHIVPFAILPWSSSSPRELFIQHAEITSIPSAFFFSQRSVDRSSNMQSGKYVLLGDPVLRFGQWRRSCLDTAQRQDAGAAGSQLFAWSRFLPSLPGTAAEVSDIAGLVRRFRPQTAVQTLLRCEATPDSLRALAGDAKLLHIATHGLIDARRPRFSTLALTPDSDPLDDGAIQLLDILHLRLRANLVVLSACDTSRGRLLPGEGVLGLAQAFLQAGAGSVVATYWRVEDSATVSFMNRFYRYLLADRLPAATALRRAQLDSADGTSYGWAAFGLYGRPGTVI